MGPASFETAPLVKVYNDATDSTMDTTPTTPSSEKKKKKKKVSRFKSFSEEVTIGTRGVGMTPLRVDSVTIFKTRSHGCGVLNSETACNSPQSATQHLLYLAHSTAFF